MAHASAVFNSVLFMLIGTALILANPCAAGGAGVLGMSFGVFLTQMWKIAPINFQALLGSHQSYSYA